MDNVITLVGNNVRDVELKFTQGGMALATFGLAVNRKWQNKQTKEWEEQVSFIDVVCWGQLAENVAETVLKGSRVMVMGRMNQNTWENDQGEKRSKHEVVADAVGVELRFATASITKNPKKDGGNFSPPNREPDFGHGHDQDEEPFIVPAADWWPDVDRGSYPERMLP